MVLVVEAFSPLMNLSLETAKTACGFLTDVPKIQSFAHKNCFGMVSASTQVACYPKDSNFNPHSRRSNKNQLGERSLDNAFFSFKVASRKKGWRLDPVLAKDLLSRLINGNKVEEAIEVANMMLSAGVVPNKSLYALMVNRLCDLGFIGSAMQLAETMVKEDRGTLRFAYNLLFNVICRHMKLDELLIWLYRFKEKGMVPDVGTNNFLIEAACLERGVDEAMKFLEKIVSEGGEIDSMAYSAILIGLCNEGRIEEATQLFRSLPSNRCQFKILFMRLCNKGLWAEAKELLAKRDGHKIRLTVSTFNILIHSLVLHRRTEDALKVLDEMKKRSIKPTAASYNPIIGQLGKEGRVEEVKNCVDRMIRQGCEPNTKTYASIAMLCEAGKVQESFAVIQFLCQLKKSSTFFFYKEVIFALCKKMKTYEAFQLLYEMCSYGFVPKSNTYLALIRGLCIEGMLHAALEILMQLDGSRCRPDIRAFNAVIVEFCKSSRTYLALELFEVMIDKGYTPNETTYSLIVEGIFVDGGKELGSEVLEFLHRKKLVKEFTIEGLALQYDVKRLQAKEQLR